MKNSKLYSLLVFALSFVIAFGGWLLTVRLLRQREEKFLSEKGKVMLQSSRIAFLEGNEAEDTAGMPEQTDGGVEGTDTEWMGFQGETMSEDMRALVLSVWERGEIEMLHEPWEGQMNMEQAIETGRHWLSLVAGSGNIPEELKECDFDQTYASLRTPRMMVQFYPDFDEAILSYWTVQFEKSGVSICLKIHALSGEVWYGDISVEGVDGIVEAGDTGKLLDRAFPFWEEGAGREIMVDLQDNITSQSFPKGKVFAAVKERQIYVSGKEDVLLITLWLYVKE